MSMLECLKAAKVKVKSAAVTDVCLQRMIRTIQYPQSAELQTVLTFIANKPLIFLLLSHLWQQCAVIFALNGIIKKKYLLIS